MRHFQYIILFTLCSFATQFLTAQSFINTIYRDFKHNTIFTESVWKKDTLIVAGTVSKVGGRTGVIFKFLDNGDLYDFNYLTNTFTNYGTGFWYKGLCIYDDTLYHIADKGFGGENLKSLILKMNSNGDVLKEKEYDSYYFPNYNFNKFVDFEKNKNGFYILEYTPKTDTDIQPCLLLTDNNFNQVWRKCFGNQTWEIPEDLLVQENGRSILLGNVSDIDVSDTYIGSGNGYFKAFMFGIDSTGNLQWEWRSSSKKEAIYAAHLVNDSIIVVAAGLGKEFCTDSQSNATCYLRWTGKVFQFNLNTKLKDWETSMSGGPYTSMFDNRYLDIIPSLEGDGYILCGAGHEIFPDCRTDTIDKCWAFPGVIAKISNEGDSVWMRKYFGVTDIYESNILYDAEITPDSGYSFVGEAFNPWTGPTQGQFGWILKTDRYGCIVPGCHLISSSDEDMKDKIPENFLKIFPNPVVDNLNIFIKKQLPSSSKVVMFNLLGQITQTFDDFEIGATYIIPTYSLSSGVYFVAVLNNNYVMECHKVIVN